MKKTIYRALSLAGVTSLIVLANACLKDDARFTDFGKATNTIEFLDHTPGKSEAVAFDDPASMDGDTIWLKVHQAGPYATGTDLVVTLGPTEEGLALYNSDAAHVVGTALPVEAYSVPATVTIKAGKDALGNPNRTAEFPLVIIPGLVPTTPGVNYVIALGVTNVSPTTTVSSNMGVLLFNFYHNPYDGDYTVTGTLTDLLAPANTGAYPMDMKLETVNATKSNAFSYFLNGYFHPINNNTSYYGNTGMVFTIDPDTNEVTDVSNYWTDPAPRNRTLRLDDTGINTWDPATKTLKVSYILHQDDLGDKAKFTEVWVHN